MPIYRYSRAYAGGCVVALCLVILMAHVGPIAAAEAKKFTLINVLFDGTKVWLPSQMIVQAGDTVELTLLNKLDEPHGFKIAAFDVEAVVQPKGKSTLSFTASKTGVYPFICHLHPPHIGGQILVLDR